MGFYINEINGNQAPAKHKVEFILNNAFGARVIKEPSEWTEGLVCVVHNANFDGAGYAFDEYEMRVFLAPDSGPQRPRTWMHVPDAKNYSGYKK